MTADMTIEGMVELLKGGARAVLMMRHAQRPHIDPEDTTFGANLPITEAGALAARSVGARLKGAAESVAFMSSPLYRTRLTAANVAIGMGVEEAWNLDTIPVAPELGNSSFYFADQNRVWQTFRDGGFYEHVFKYIREKRMDGFAQLDDATDRLEEFVLAHANAQLSIFTTHDLYNAAFLSARGAAPEWTVENWVGFLDSAAIILHPGGRREYALVRSSEV